MLVVLVEEIHFKVGGFSLHLRASFRVPPPYDMNPGRYWGLLGLPFCSEFGILQEL
jgi:hypothetical protein